VCVVCVCISLNATEFAGSHYIDGCWCITVVVVVVVAKTGFAFNHVTEVTHFRCITTSTATTTRRRTTCQWNKDLFIGRRKYGTFFIVRVNVHNTQSIFALRCVRFDNTTTNIKRFGTLEFPIQTNKICSNPTNLFVVVVVVVVVVVPSITEIQ